MRTEVSWKPPFTSTQRHRVHRQTGKVELLFPGRVFVHELCLRSMVLDVRRFVHFLCGIETSIVLRKNDDLVQETGMRSGRQTRQYFRNLSNLTEQDKARHISHAIRVQRLIRKYYEKMTNRFQVVKLGMAMRDYSRPRQNMFLCQKTTQLGQPVWSKQGHVESVSQ